jgi:hypothetical protein
MNNAMGHIINTIVVKSNKPTYYNQVLQPISLSSATETSGDWYYVGSLPFDITTKFLNKITAINIFMIKIIFFNISAAFNVQICKGKIL